MKRYYFIHTPLKQIPYSDDLNGFILYDNLYFDFRDLAFKPFKKPKDLKFNRKDEYINFNDVILYIKKYLETYGGLIKIDSEFKEKFLILLKNNPELILI